MDRLHKALEKIPRVSLIPQPTPLSKLERLSEEWGTPVWIKRDDLTGLGPGGNKLRNLEFMMAEALRGNADVVLAAGPLQSNFCTLTAAAAAKLGLPCETVHNSPVPERIEGNLLINRLLGAEAHYIGAVSSEERTAWTARRLEALKQAGRRPYLAAKGGAAGSGVLGYAAAVEEMEKQWRETGSGERLTIFAPAGNGGMGAGLVYGNALAGRPFDIVLISVENDRETLIAELTRAVRDAEDVTGEQLDAPVETFVTVYDDFRGAGWGENTPESAEMVRRFAAAEGILIENVYNSKVLVGMEALVREGRITGPVCFLHSGGFGSLFAQFD